MSASDCELIEVFSAIQGEGPIIGRRQVFVRFGRCDVVCDYCDTPLCHVPVSHARIETSAAARCFERHANPVSPVQLASWVRRLLEPAHLHHSLALTGGEPLLHPETIVALREELSDLEVPFYLETDGHLFEALRQVLGVIDLVGMDNKLPSASGFPAKDRENRVFLQILKDAGIPVFVKLVLCQQTSDEEFAAALQIVADISPQTECILQPVTPFAGRGEAPTPERLLALDELARGVLPHVRVIPQTHKMLKQL